MTRRMSKKEQRKARNTMRRSIEKLSDEERLATATGWLRTLLQNELYLHEDDHGLCQCRFCYAQWRGEPPHEYDCEVPRIRVFVETAGRP